MSGYISSTALAAAYVGATPAVAVYLGATQVWSAAPAGPPYADDFNRENHPDLGDAWTDIGFGATMKIASNCARGTDNDTLALALYDLVVATDDHKVSIVCGAPGSIGDQVQLIVRANGNTAGNFSDRVQANCSSNSGPWNIDMYVGDEILWSDYSGAQTWTTGTEISLEASGNTFILKKNGTPVLTTVPDPPYPADSGHRLVGIGNIPTGAGSAGINSFAADDL